MRLGSILLTIACLVLLAGSSRAQSNAPLQSFEGSTSQVTPAFQAPDSWEVCWRGARNVNVAVMAADGSVVGGGAGPRGAIYLPKGGSYHLQIDYAPLPQLANPSTPPSSQNPYNPVTRDNYGDQQNNNQPANPIQNRMLALLSGPYTVQVMSASAPPDSAAGDFSAVPFFKVPAGAAPGTTAASWSNNAGAHPAPATPPAAAAAPATPPANLSQDQARAVVLIKGDNGEGTGFLVRTKDGPAIITNQHVISNNPNVVITSSNGVTIDVVSAKAATDRDLAMLAIKDASYSYLTLATDVTAVSPGDQVVTPGNSEGGEVMLNTTGKVLAIGPDRIEIDNPIYHGNSGGPVFDTKTNQVIGVVTEAMKVDTSDELDKASFTSRNSAIQNSMRYFALRVDNVPQWEDIDWKAYQSETAFLDKFDLRSRCLDSFLNPPATTDNSQGQGQAQSSTDSADADLWRQDTVLMRANEQFEDQSGGNVDTGQQLDALRELLGGIVDAASTDVATIQNVNNFYTYDRQRAKEEMAYRQAIKDELDTISNNVSRLGSLPRKN